MYIISYITQNGSLVLNNTVKAEKMCDAITLIRETEDVKVILSIVGLN